MGFCQAGDVVEQVFIPCACVRLSARRPAGKRVEACSQAPGGRGCGSRSPATAPALAPKPEQPVCEQAVAFMIFFSSLDVSSSFFRRTFFLQRAICYPQGAKSLSVGLHYDLFGSLKRNEHPQSTERASLRPAAVPRVRRSKVFKAVPRSSYEAKILADSLCGYFYKTQFFGLHSSGGHAPQVHRQTTGQRHDGFLAGRG
jgi:hypothetical protein